jgi:hypothetical protein
VAPLKAAADKRRFIDKSVVAINDIAAKNGSKTEVAKRWRNLLFACLAVMPHDLLPGSKTFSTTVQKMSGDDARDKLISLFCS